MDLNVCKASCAELSAFFICHDVIHSRGKLHYLGLGSDDLSSCLAAMSRIDSCPMPHPKPTIFKTRDPKLTPCSHKALLKLYEDPLEPLTRLHPENLQVGLILVYLRLGAWVTMPCLTSSRC